MQLCKEQETHQYKSDEQVPQQKSEEKKLQSLSVLPYLFNFTYKRKKLKKEL